MPSFLKFYKVFRPIYAPVMDKVHLWARKNYNVMFVLKLLRRSHSNVFRRYVASFAFPEQDGTDAARVIHLPLHHYGPKNKGKIVMLMSHDASNAGIGAIWVYYLNRLAFSDKMGFYHVFECTKNLYYQENEPVHGKTSVFEYYFKQPSDISIEDAYESNTVVLDWNNPEFGYNDYFAASGTDGYEYTKKDIDKYAEIQRKYFKLQPWAEEKITEDIAGLLGDCKVLGVHARGADTKIRYKNHPAPVEAEDYVSAARQTMEKIGAEKVFLATDDQEMLEKFHSEFGDDLIWYKDVIRSPGTVMNCYIENERPHHRYLLGLEAIRDVYTLAACQGLVCGVSCISFVAQVLKESKYEQFADIVRLSNGISQCGLNMHSAADREKVREQWSRELGRSSDAKAYVEREKVPPTKRGGLTHVIILFDLRSLYAGLSDVTLSGV